MLAERESDARSIVEKEIGSIELEVRPVAAGSSDVEHELRDRRALPPPRVDVIGGDFGFVKDHVGALKMPVLILWGEEDHLIPVETARVWNKAIPGSKLIIYPATGHIPMEEVADKSAADVRLFLSGP